VEIEEYNRRTPGQGDGDCLLSIARFEDLEVVDEQSPQEAPNGGVVVHRQYRPGRHCH
jgi:hypothetical protein